MPPSSEVQVLLQCPLQPVQGGRGAGALVEGHPGPPLPLGLPPAHPPHVTPLSLPSLRLVAPLVLGAPYQGCDRVAVLPLPASAFCANDPGRLRGSWQAKIRAMQVGQQHGAGPRLAAWDVCACTKGDGTPASNSSRLIVLRGGGVCIRYRYMACHCNLPCLLRCLAALQRLGWAVWGLSMTEWTGLLAGAAERAGLDVEALLEEAVGLLALPRGQLVPGAAGPGGQQGSGVGEQQQQQQQQGGGVPPEERARLAAARGAVEQELGAWVVRGLEGAVAALRAQQGQ